MSNLSKVLSIIFFITCCVLAVVFLIHEDSKPNSSLQTQQSSIKTTLTPIKSQQTQQLSLNPLTIQAMKQRLYTGSDITIEQSLPDGSNYHQYLTSYTSDGLKIYALLTIPIGNKPKNGWPVILFNHGYITPQTYQTFPASGQYASYYPMFAKNGYIVFKPDYRGNGNSQGQPEGAYYSPGYTIDDLNALASIKKYKDADPNKIGVWGHSMGGNITLRDIVIDSKDIKAAVIWGGVVGTYDQLLNWHDPNYHPSAYELSLRNKHRTELTKQYGTPNSNPQFWNTIDPTNFVRNITTPVQLNVGGNDEEVPIAFSKTLRDKLQQAGKTVEYYEYPGDNHNISNSFIDAMQHSLDFFNKYLK